MGSLQYPELLENPRYRKFLHRAHPWYGHVGIIHLEMTDLVRAASTGGLGSVDFCHCNGYKWTDNIWIRPLISRNLDSVMTNLREFVLSLLKFTQPTIKILDSEWGDAEIVHNREFLGNLSIVPYTCPCEQSFELIVNVKLKFRRHRKSPVPIMSKPVRLWLDFKKNVLQVPSLR